MFEVNPDTAAITMHSGDTGSFTLHAERASGESWTEDDRMQMTVTSPAGIIVMKRYYRLDDQYDLGDGTVLIEFHNDDTDDWTPGAYSTEFRFDVDPIWEGGEIPTGRCVDALREAAQMVEGGMVRTQIQSTLTIQGVLGKI